ncbi:MAG: glycosyltransferase family 2 protein [Pseudomonadota bacterium]|nr:glycosyltransferase family 2 protein [Pseudomonadota bacterium]
MLKVSVITVCYNSVSSVERTLVSVINQKYMNVEYIVIDGGSSDGTVDIIQKYINNISCFISESDNGIYDALNKGISYSTGDIICFLHSDDVYAHDQVIFNVVENFKNNDTLDAVYGDLKYYYNNSDVVSRYWVSREFSKKLLTRGWMPPHPTLFLRKSVYLNYGVFDTSYKISADYDFILRVFSANGFNSIYVKDVLVNMSLGGVSNASFKNILIKSKEDFHCLLSNGFGRYSALFALFIKNISKVSQFLLE